MRRLENVIALLLIVCLLVGNSVDAFAAPANNTTTPPAPSLSYSPMTPTKGNVIVTVYYPTGAKSKQYRLGTNGVWTTYLGSFTLTSNEHVTARYQSKTGKWSTIGGVTVSNIDKISPINPTFSATPTSLTNQNVTITISFSSDSLVKEYKLGDTASWTNYTAPILLSSNNIIYAKAIDAVGNISATVSYEVINIDNIAPAEPVLTADNIQPTHENVLVSMIFDTDAHIKTYKIGSDGSWLNYTTPVVIQENTIVYAKAQDLAGNWSSEASLAVTNIDKVVLSEPLLSLSSTIITNKEVTVTIQFTMDSVLRMYKVGSNGTWVDYVEPVVMYDNNTIFAKAQDIAGNWSNEGSLVISNIDKLAPISPEILISDEMPTNKDVTVTIQFSADSSSKLYKLGVGGSWLEYSSPITLSTNETVFAKSTDLAGNWTQEVSYTINNIDVTGPETPIIYPSVTTPTSQPITLTIVYGAESGLKQYKVGLMGTWMDYTVPVVITTNTVIYAKASDFLGNWSLESSLSVTNISKKTILGYTVKYGLADMSSYNSMVANVSTISEIATATYTIDGLGNLTGTAPTDQINYANNNGIRPNLMVGNNFDSSIAKQLLQSPENRARLKNQILNILMTYGYKGVDIDIENIPAICRNDFTTFMREVYTTLKPLGYGVTVAVPAKVNDASTSTWNYAFDYQSLADYADYLMIMAYDEHYPGGTPGAIASINWVNNVVNYSLSMVPKEKIVLGLGAYGYDWSVGATKAYSINGCINLAKQYGSTIYFDLVTQSKYFTYTVSGVTHTVWFEDGETIGYKLDLVNRVDLKGIGIWRLGLENAGFWDAIKAKINK